MFTISLPVMLCAVMVPRFRLSGLRFGSTQRIYSSAELPLQIPSGLCAVYKPKGWTSADVVQKVKTILEKNLRIQGHKKKSVVKVGHGGTLDPMAEGVLILGLDSGTKLLSGFLSGNKAYEAVALLGTSMDTLDVTGKLIESRDCSHITHDMLESVLHKFRGDILQMPPMYSALHHNGQRLYDLARKGIDVERKARPVHISKLELTSNRELPYFGLSVECEGGTYVRSLIDDICKEVGGIGCMAELIRSRQSVFTLEHSLSEEFWNYDNIIQNTIKCNELANVPTSVSKNMKN